MLSKSNLKIFKKIYLIASVGLVICQLIIGSSFSTLIFALFAALFYQLVDHFSNKRVLIITALQTIIGFLQSGFIIFAEGVEQTLQGVGIFILLIFLCLQLLLGLLLLIQELYPTKFLKIALCFFCSVFVMGNVYLSTAASINQNLTHHAVFYARDIKLKSNLSAQDFLALHYYHILSETTEINYVHDDAGIHDSDSNTFNVKGTTISSYDYTSVGINNNIYYSTDKLPVEDLNLIYSITQPVIKSSRKPLINLQWLFDWNVRDRFE